MKQSNPTMYVDRDGFIAWTEGSLMERRGNRAMVVNTTKCRKAVSAMDRGEVIGLTRDEKLVSTMCYDETKGYVETMCGEE